MTMNKESPNLRNSSWSLSQTMNLTSQKKLETSSNKSGPYTKAFCKIVTKNKVDYLNKNIANSQVILSDKK